jgi:hypothetical protein
MLHAHFAQVLETDQHQGSCQANLKTVVTTQ